MLDIDYSNLNKIKQDKYGRVSGIFAFDKPVGLTSHDVVHKVRKKLKTRKVGHAGALDPFATGVLLILVGRFTKKTEQLIKEDKSYECRILFGVNTDSHDIDGNVINTDYDFELQKEKLQEVIKELNEKYEQYVPIFSSVKYNGIKLRNLARQSKNFEVYEKEGKKFVRAEIDENTSRKLKNKSDDLKFDFELPKKPVDVNIQIIDTGKLNSEQIESIKLPEDLELDYADISVDCSKGTYIRRIASDLGERMGSYGMLLNLRRTRVGQVSIEDAIKIEDLQEL